MTLFGVDVSTHQGTISWPAVKAAGIEFSVARASIGTATDATYPSRIKGALGQGMVAGAYHFLTAGDASDQADVFVTATNACHGILAALDCEADGLTAADIRAFAARFEERTDGHPLFIYTGISWWRSHGNPSLKNLGPLWLAFYPGGGYPGDASPVWNTALGGTRPTIWQYGPRPIKGRKPVDGDAFRGTRAELEAYMGGSAQNPNQPGGPVATITKVPYSPPRVVHVPAGSTLAGFAIQDDGTLKQSVPPQPFPTGSSFHANAVVTGSAFAGAYFLADDGVFARALVTTRGNTPDPDPVPDCTAAMAAAIAAATKPLEDQITVLTGQVAGARERQHEVDVKAVQDAPTT